MAPIVLESEVPLKKQTGPWHLEFGYGNPGGIRVISRVLDLEFMQLDSDLTPSCFLILGQSPLIIFKWECQHHFTGLLRDINVHGSTWQASVTKKKNNPNALTPWLPVILERQSATANK